MRQCLQGSVWLWSRGGDRREGLFRRHTFHTEWRWTPGGPDPLRGEVGRALCLRSGASKQETDRQTDRERQRQTDLQRQRERETGAERERETDRQTERDRDRERQRETERQRPRLEILGDEHILESHTLPWGFRYFRVLKGVGFVKSGSCIAKRLAVRRSDFQS